MRKCLGEVLVQVGITTCNACSLFPAKGCLKCSCINFLILSVHTQELNIPQDMTLCGYSCYHNSISEAGAITTGTVYQLAIVQLC